MKPYSIDKELRIEIISGLLDVAYMEHLQQINLKVQELLKKELDDYRLSEAKR